MLSTFHSIEVGKKSLIAQQLGINVTGNNLVNINNKDHSRVKVTMASDYELFPIGPSSPKLNGQIGSGTIIQSVERVRDMFLEGRIINQAGIKGYWTKLTSLLKKIEALYNEPGEFNLQTSLNKFIEAWDKLSQYPTEFAHRELLKSRTHSLTSDIQNLFKRLHEMRLRVNAEVHSMINDINHKTKQVAELNKQILQLKMEKKSPNTLLDKRDVLINQLSKLVNMEVSYKDEDDQVMLFIESQILVQGQAHEKIKIISDTKNEGLNKLVWLNKDSELIVKKGALSSLLKVRDQVIPNHIKSLDHFALNLMESVNRFHEKGFGLNGETRNSFFDKKYIGGISTGSFDPNQSGKASSSGIYRIQGNEMLNSDDMLGIRGTLKFKDSKGSLIKIDYIESDTIKSVITKINQSSSAVVAYLTSEGYLSFKAMPDLNSQVQDFYISHLEDSNVLLSDFAGIFNKNQSIYDSTMQETFKNLNSEASYYISPYKNPSSWISISDKINNNLALIATASSYSSESPSGKGDGRVALKIVANLTHSEEYYSKEFKEISKYGFYLDKQANGFHDFLNQNLEKVAAYTERSELESQKSESIFQHLDSMRQSISGVNLNEEVSSILQYQHAYHASAKFITYADKMLETLIFKLGA